MNIYRLKHDLHAKMEAHLQYRPALLEIRIFTTKYFQWSIKTGVKQKQLQQKVSFLVQHVVTNDGWNKLSLLNI